MKKKITSIFEYNALKIIYTHFSTWWNNIFMSLSVSHDLKNSQMSIKKLKIWQTKFFPKSTNVGFCDNFIARSLVLIPKYTICEFYGYWTVFKKTRQFWIWKKKQITFFFFVFFQKNSKPWKFHFFFYLNHCKIVQKNTTEKHSFLDFAVNFFFWKNTKKKAFFFSNSKLGA